AATSPDRVAERVARAVRTGERQTAGRDTATAAESLNVPAEPVENLAITRRSRLIERRADLVEMPLRPCPAVAPVGRVRAANDSPLHLTSEGLPLSRPVQSSSASSSSSSD